ncbi:suppressor of fused domain protein [Tomitella biformata]|uniref:suppressor of fused domain protein n=1 Tax=Tomitella biformata TaxID=630403 RepID=UPI0004675760|nr:suppressor of fused domain protein [Tomitella biformata]
MAQNVAATVKAHLVERFGEPSASASVTFLGLEAVDVLCFADNGVVRYASVGCARTPMNDPTQILNDPHLGPRAEVIISIRNVGVHPNGLHRRVAVLAAAPAVEGVVLAADGLMDLGEPLWDGSRFSAVLLGPSDVPDLALAAPADAEPRDPVQFLEAVPITATEAAWVRVRGAEALREAWAEAKIDVTDPTRGPVTL